MTYAPRTCSGTSWRLFWCVLALGFATAATADDLGLRHGDLVTITRVDGGHEQARFVESADDPFRLRLATTDGGRWGTGWSSEVRGTELMSVEAAGAKHFEAHRPFAGMLVGMVIGGAIGYATADPPDEGRIENTVNWMRFGSIMGVLGGLFVARSTGAPRRWTFDDGGHPLAAPAGR